VKKISYNDFWQKMHARARKEAIPLRVMFELTYECNFKCKHCYVPRAFQRRYQKRQLKTKDVFKVLDQLKAAGCLYLGFTGGEPFMRKDILRILEYSRKLGFQAIVYTNGSLLTDKIVNRLARLRLNKVDITLPGMTESVFESITGKAGSHRAVFKAIEALRRKNIPLGFKSCLLKQNTSEIEEIKKFCYSLDASHRLDALLSCRLDGSSLPYKFRGGTPIIKTGRQPLDYKPSAAACEAKEKAREPLFFCGVGNSQAAITPAGELKLCLMIDKPRYDILKKSFSGAWEMARVFVSSVSQKNYDRCGKCRHKAYCPWCPARGWLAQKDFSACDSRMRAWLDQSRKEYENKH
jgi:radical SAM protein with 4Fe4S-binding SPASM domain